MQAHEVGNFILDTLWDLEIYAHPKLVIHKGYAWIRTGHKDQNIEITPELKIILHGTPFYKKNQIPWTLFNNMIGKN